MVNVIESLDKFQKGLEKNADHATSQKSWFFIDQIKDLINIDASLTQRQEVSLKLLLTTNVGLGQTGIFNAMLVATWINSCR